MDINSFSSKGRISAKELITLKNVSQNDVLELLYMAKELKTMVKFGEHNRKIKGKNVILISKSSLGVSRIAFEIATRSVDGNPITMLYKGSHVEELVNNPESIKVINRFGISAVVVDTSVESDAEMLSKYLDIPVINANEDRSPCQALATLLSVWENRGRLSGLKATVIGNVNNFDASLVYGMAKCGMDVSIVSPESEKPNAEIMDYLNQFCVATHTSNLNEALKNTDVIFCYSHNFGSDFVITEDKISSLCPKAMFMTNIPLVRGETASSEVIDSPNSFIYEQGENVMNVERSAIYLLSI